MDHETEVAKIASVEEAKVAVSYLRANGIDARIADFHTKTVMGGLSWGGYRILVPTEKSAMAKNLLAAAGSEDDET